MKKTLPSFLALLVATSTNSQAVVVATPNTSNPPGQAPANGAPWDNVLISNTSSSIFLGGGWVLSAEHVYDDVDPAFVTFGGTNYLRDPNLVFVLDNPSAAVTAGLSAKSDLVLFRLTENLPLPTIQLGNVTALTEITMIGFGGGKSWGTNARDPGLSFPATVPGNNGFVAFSSDYDSTTPTEGQAVGGDSGGAAFFQDAGEWKLGGVMLAVSSDSTDTFYADLSFYRDQIETIILTNGNVPEPSVVFLSFAALPLLLRRRR